MGTIGQQLVQPEEGWKRYDNTYPTFKYIGTWTKGTRSSYSNLLGAKLIFKFKGNGIKIITSFDSNRSSKIEVTLDGVKEVISMYRSSVLDYAVAYEQNNLPSTDHEISITFIGTDGYVQINAIDIDSTGRLFHPDEVTDIKDLDIGKRIRCHYQATANTVGAFSNLGQETSDFIPATSSNIPNGDFYWIMVDDENKKRKLIADRNIQHSISWDTLNSAGIASGSGLPVNLNLSSRHFSVIKLLTGGVNNTDKDNEWDKYIVSSTLNGSIVAGDNNVWNWSGNWSWLSTSHIANSSTKVVRGNTGANTHSFNSTNSSGVSLSFRPVLIIEDTLKTHTFIKSNNQYKTFKNNQWNNISTTLPSESVFVSDGMQNLSILDRKETEFTQDMANNGILDEGKVFKSTIDLKKLFEIKSIEIE